MLDNAYKVDSDRRSLAIYKIRFMKIIMLTGPSDSGKTKTLHDLYKQLSPEGANDVEPPKPHPLDNRDSVYYLRYNNKKIGIVTLGDYCNEILSQIIIFLNKGADVLVIANSNKVSAPLHTSHNDLVDCVIVKKNNIHEIGKVQEIIELL